jgi:hypothetical protein
VTNNTLTVSLNEVSFIVTRAAVGAGATFGVAEDFAKAVIWASRCEVDPAVMALACLNRLDVSPGSGCMTVIEKGPSKIFEGQDGLSVVFGGTALSDFWRLSADDGGSMMARDLDCPLIAAASLAVVGPAPAVVEWPNARVTFGKDGSIDMIARDIDTFLGKGRADISVSVEPVNEEVPTGFALTVGELEVAAKRAIDWGLNVDADAGEGVGDLLRRCLVPSTDLSRMSGAGAGLVDTD